MPPAPTPLARRPPLAVVAPDDEVFSAREVAVPISLRARVAIESAAPLAADRNPLNGAGRLYVGLEEFGTATPA
jgi:hypothetical protein